MNTPLRLFVAIELDETIYHALARTQANLQAQVPAGTVRWSQPHTIHLTLKFLGDTPAAQVPALLHALKAAAASFAPFELAAGGFGCFPGVRGARVLWVGVDPLPRPLLGLQRAVELQLSRLGYARETRAFAPHLTLGRVQDGLRTEQRTALTEALAAVQVGPLGVMPVQRATLFSSEFNRQGMIYRALGQCDLTAEA